MWCCVVSGALLSDAIPDGMWSPRGKEKQRMGLRPVFSTHVAPRRCRCEHGAPAQGVGLVDFLETMFRLAVFRCEGVGGFVQVFGFCGAGLQEDAVGEGYVLVFLYCVVEFRGLWVEDVLAQGIGGEEAVASGMPVGGVVGIVGMVEDDDGFFVSAGVAG